MSHENQNKFQIGDTVTWTSQAGGNAKTKTGKVVAVLPANKSVAQFYREGGIVGDFYLTRIPIIISSRDHESYLIQVGKSKRLYWPLVKYLKFKCLIDGCREERSHQPASLACINHTYVDVLAANGVSVTCDDIPLPEPNRQSKQPKNLQEP